MSWRRTDVRAGEAHSPRGHLGVVRAAWSTGTDTGTGGHWRTQSRRSPPKQPASPTHLPTGTGSTPEQDSLSLSSPLSLPLALPHAGHPPSTESERERETINGKKKMVSDQPIDTHFTWVEFLLIFSNEGRRSPLLND